MNRKRILAINPGSTSTKVAVYEDRVLRYQINIEHSNDEISKYENIQDQFELRKVAIEAFLTEKEIPVDSLDAVVGRGGLLPPVSSGAYLVNELMLDRLHNNPVAPHASNLGAAIAYAIAKPIGKPAYIYDSVAVDEMRDIARISGMPEIPRVSLSHALNSRAMAHQVAEENNTTYDSMNFIIAHLGGGISLSAHEKGRIVDIIADDEGPFSPERSGRVPCKSLVDLCYSGKYDRKTMQKKLRGNGGLVAYLGTSDTREVLERASAGDEEAETVIEAMAYQIAKGIGEMAVVLEGKVDAIIITGGIAHSQVITDLIKRRVEFISQVVIKAGENEMQSLAYGALRVLNKEEEAKSYIE